MEILFNLGKCPDRQLVILGLINRVKESISSVVNMPDNFQLQSLER